MYLCTWFNKKMNRIELANINLNDKVADFKNSALFAIESESQHLEFIYRGCVLHDDKCLADYEIQENSEIHVIERQSESTHNMESDSTNLEDDIQDIATTFKMLIQFPNFRPNVQRILKNSAMTDLQKNVPEISQDVTTISILFDSELLIQLSEIATVRALSKKYPVFVRAAKFFANYIHEQSHCLTQQPTTSTGYSYSLDALSDDDDMESNTESRDSYPITRNSSFNAITSAQLAAAIANATNTTFNTNSAGVTSTPVNTPNIITSEMFSNAIQQAYGTTPNSTPPVTPVEGVEMSLSALATRFENELRQMHELGLLNDRINIRALQATFGNLQEAVELVLNGVID